MDRINWVTSDCFNAIGQLARLGDHAGVEPELVHARVKAFLQAMAKRAQEAGYTEQDTKLALYAVTALADETVMATSGALRDYWATRPLQLVLFAENVAGERFFEHLEAIRGRPQVDVLRVYYLCLLFGFRGRYGVRGAELTISDLVDGVRAELTRALSLPEVLAPNGARPEDLVTDSVRRLPVLAGCLALVALAGLLYLGLWVSLGEQLAQFVAWTRQAGGRG